MIAEYFDKIKTEYCKLETIQDQQIVLEDHLVTAFVAEKVF